MEACICVATQCQMAQQMNPHVRLKSCLCTRCTIAINLLVTVHYTAQKKGHENSLQVRFTSITTYSSFSECTAGIPGGSRKGNINNVLTTE